MISEEEENEQSNEGGTKRKADSKTISTGANNTGEMESSQSNATGVTEDRLQLLGIVTGAFRPGVLTVVLRCWWEHAAFVVNIKVPECVAAEILLTVYNSAYRYLVIEANDTHD
ncbi:hypothetical protein LWI29_004498 [Acer saccharum]|uniref:Uncharacterized protein n=1 Tax=Acer saccharum TaxID=4024 RepID=A0AA39VQT2_ACESA|nr:hypothetical protein LWI29_004498 [Acer saccharum]